MISTEFYWRVSTRWVAYPVWSKNSCGFTRVVFQQSPEPFTTLKWACTLCVLVNRRKEQHVALALMIALMMKMRHILRQRMAERRFATQNQPCEAVWSKNSCGLALIIFQQSSKPFATPDRAFVCRVLADRRKEQHVTLALMIALVMIMLHVLTEGATQGRFSKQNHPRETFLLDRSHPPLRVGVQIRRPRWQGHPLDASLIDETLRRWAEFITFPRI